MLLRTGNTVTHDFKFSATWPLPRVANNKEAYIIHICALNITCRVSLLRCFLQLLILKGQVYKHVPLYIVCGTSWFDSWSGHTKDITYSYSVVILFAKCSAYDVELGHVSDTAL